MGIPLYQEATDILVVAFISTIGSEDIESKIIKIFKKLALSLKGFDSYYS